MGIDKVHDILERLAESGGDAFALATSQMTDVQDGSRMGYLFLGMSLEAARRLRDLSHVMKGLATEIILDAAKVPGTIVFGYMIDDGNEQFDSAFRGRPEFRRVDGRRIREMAASFPEGEKAEDCGIRIRPGAVSFVIHDRKGDSWCDVDPDAMLGAVEKALRTPRMEGRPR